jgi:hypothetical protein
VLHLVLLALAVETHAVAVRPEAQPGCPAAGDVQAALASRLPRALVPIERAREQGALVLGLDKDDLGAATLSLTDRQGRERLHRTLELPAGSKDCKALAETAALIVERYLVTLAYEPPPPPPPPPAPAAPPPRRWEVSVAGSWRPGADGWGGFEVGGRVGRWLHRRLLLALGAGIGGWSRPVPQDSRYRGEAWQRRFPLELGLWWSTAPAFAELQLGGGGALDITRTHAKGDLTDQQTLPGPALWVAAAVRAPLGRRMFARLSSGVVGSLIQYDFSYRAGTEGAPMTAFSAPPRRFYARIAADVGFTLP